MFKTYANEWKLLGQVYISEELSLIEYSSVSAFSSILGRIGTKVFLLI